MYFQSQLISKLFLQYISWVLLIYLNSNLSANAQAFINLESGAFFTNINDIPNGNNGTLISLKNDFQTPVSPFLRLRAGYLSNGKNHFSKCKKYVIYVRNMLSITSYI